MRVQEKGEIKMKKIEAFTVLRMKDFVEAVVVPVSRDMGVIIGALALLCLNTAAFRTLAIAAMAAGTVFIVAKAAIFISRKAIAFLGFSEPGLERMALA